MSLRRILKRVAHRTGLVASPSLSFLGVPFGFRRRDLAAEVLAALDERHDVATCPLCAPDEAAANEDL